MRVPKRGILLVVARELRWMWRDRIALLLVIGIPIFGFALLSYTFSNAVIRDLRIDIVDSDKSDMSLNYIQAVASAPGVSVSRRSGDLTGAMHATRSGDAIASVYIPANFERDFLALKRPQIVVLYNRQYFTPGNSASAAISGAIAAATQTFALPKGNSFSPGPLVVEQYVLTNPALNYTQFLLRAVLPTVLHVIAAVAGGYAVGSEFAMRNSRAWLNAAGGSPLAALVGKLAPLFAIFLLMMVIVAAIIHGLFHVPFRGNSLVVGGGAVLLLLAYLSLGALLQLLLKNLALGLSVTAIICSPAFGYAGVGFPILAMNGFARGWADVLPLRWYIQILFDQAVRGLPAAISAPLLLILLGLACLFFGLAWLRLKSLAGKGLPGRFVWTPTAPLRSLPYGAGYAMLAELRAVLGNKSAFGLFILAPVIYGVFYPQPYLGQLLRDIPIAVVDQDRTEVSRNLIQSLNAHEAIEVAVSADTLADAQAALDRRQVFAIVGVPEGTAREVLKGNPARLPAYVDAAYFLMYNRMLQGIKEAASAVTQDIVARGARIDGSLAHAAGTKVSPVMLLSEPLFNPTGGYASYIVPAAFMLIVQQTVLMGSATMGGAAFQEGGAYGRYRRGRARAIVGQALAHLILAIPGLILFLVVLPRIYGFSTLGRLLDLTLMAIPFVLSVSFFAQFVGIWFKRGETAVLLFIATSLPIFFTVGVSWPIEAIPTAVRVLSQIIPSTSAIDGLVRINQMGASLHDVSADWRKLWILTLTYAVFAIVSARLVSRKIVFNAQ